MQPLDVERLRAARALGGEDLLNHAQQVATVAVGHGQQGGAGILSQSEAATHQGLGARQQLGQGGLVQAAQDHDLAARQEGAVQLEARVLGGRADQDDRPVLDIGQEGVLLGAVEAVDLVDEQERALPDLAAASSSGEDLAQVGHPGEGRRDLLEDQAGAVGQESGDRRLAAARRAPQDDGGQAARGDHAAQRGAGGEQLVLADDIVERSWAQPVGQRAGRVVDWAGSVGTDVVEQ